jgi:hypothetical protein
VVTEGQARQTGSKVFTGDHSADDGLDHGVEKLVGEPWMTLLGITGALRLLSFG